MATKNAIYKVDDGQGGFDEIDFKTNAAQVFFDNGDTLKDKFNIKDGVLWRGYHHMAAKESIYPTKKLSQCRGGWVLVWSDYNNGGQGENFNYCYTYIPKNTIAKDGQNHDFVVSAGEGDDNMTNKCLYICDDHFSGNEINKEGKAWDVVIRAVIEY